MSNLVIQAEGLTKEYQLGVINHGTLQNDFQSWWARLRGKEDPNLCLGTEQCHEGRFHALDDVSFNVHQGDAVGLIGRNGAGKSTLLKILSRITAPTRGKVRLKGRVASLLEVGTGFHPELTGRENVFLNGAILGLKAQEIRRKFDEIVAFAGVDRFIDTPVKRYSSGMYVRLAFAVAAHLEPEILIVDEVLAVGDAQFQKKCLGKMEDIGKDGRTILFVSHNMTAVRNLCDRVLWINNGQIAMEGSTPEVTESYLRQDLRSESLEEVQYTVDALPPDNVFRLDAISVQQSGVLSTTILNNKPFEIEISYTVFQQISGLRVYFDLCDDGRNILIRSFNDDDADCMSLVEPGRYVSKAVIPPDLLAPLIYELRVYGTIYNERNIPSGGVGITLVVEKNNNINRGYPQDQVRSKLQPRIPWSTTIVEKGI